MKVRRGAAETSRGCRDPYGTRPRIPRGRLSKSQGASAGVWLFLESVNATQVHHVVSAEPPSQCQRASN